MPNGIAIATIKKSLSSISLTTPVAGSSLYSHPSYTGRSVYLPADVFVSVIDVNMAVNSSGYTLCQVAGFNTERIITRIFSTYSSTVSSVYESYTVMGRWK